MIAAKIEARDLTDYYTQLVFAQEAAHGSGYCSHHAIIREHAQACVSYAELGINEGATLACALLAGYLAVEGVDIALKPIRASEGLFRAAARARGTHLSLWEQSSLLPIGETGFLLIDTRHEPGHLRQELEVHGPFVREKILVHDTGKVPALHHMAQQWGLRNGWTVERRQPCGYGWTLLSRTA